MFKYLIAYLGVGLLSCHHNRDNIDQKTDSPAVTTAIDTGVMADINPPEVPLAVPDTIRIDGDFNGDGNLDTAFGVLLRRAMEEEGQDEYVIRFSDGSIHQLETGYGEIRLINEGDLNNDGRDDISVYQAPLHGCTYNMNTYSYSGDKWKSITGTWLVLSGCNYLSDEDLQNRIVVEDGTVYYYQEDPNDEHFALQKKEMVMR